MSGCLQSLRECLEWSGVRFSVLMLIDKHWIIKRFNMSGQVYLYRPSYNSSKERNGVFRCDVSVPSFIMDFCNGLKLTLFHLCSLFSLLKQKYIVEQMGLSVSQFRLFVAVLNSSLTIQSFFPHSSDIFFSELSTFRYKVRIKLKIKLYSQNCEI